MATSHSAEEGEVSQARITYWFVDLSSRGRFLILKMAMWLEFKIAVS